MLGSVASFVFATQHPFSAACMFYVLTLASIWLFAVVLCDGYSESELGRVNFPLLPCGNVDQSAAAIVAIWVAIITNLWRQGAMVRVLLEARAGALVVVWVYIFMLGLSYEPYPSHM